MIRRDPKRPASIIIGKRLRITASRFPWQVRRQMAWIADPKTEAVGTRYGWRGTPGTGRFGGGWNWCIGFRAGGKSIYLELLIGALTVSWRAEKAL